MAWSHDTEIRAYEGEVEHFVSADSAGVGVRVIHEGRQGLSWAGVLDEDALAECLAEARDNATFGSVDPDAGLAEPDGVVPVELRLYDERLLEVDTEAKIAMAVELEALVRGGDVRISGVESADYADSVMATAIASTTGIRSAGAETSVYVGTYAWLADDGDDTTTGFGFSVGRSVEDLDVAAAAAEAVERCVRLIGATQGAERAPDGRAPPVRHLAVPGPDRRDALRRVGAAWRSPFAGRLGEGIAASGFTMFDDPTDPAAPTASDTDGEGLACRRVPLITDGVLSGYLHNAYTARASGTASTGSAQRSSPRSAPGVGPHVVTLTPGTLSADEVIARGGRGSARARHRRAPLRRQPGLGRPVGRRRGGAHPRR